MSFTDCKCAFALFYFGQFSFGEWSSLHIVLLQDAPEMIPGRFLADVFFLEFRAFAAVLGNSLIPAVVFGNPQFARSTLQTLRGTGIAFLLSTLHLRDCFLTCFIVFSQKNGCIMQGAGR